APLVQGVFRSRVTLTGPTSGALSPLIVRSVICHVKVFSSVGVSVEVARTLSPSAVTPVDFEDQPFSVRDHMASPRLPSPSTVHDLRPPVAGSIARICTPVDAVSLLSLGFIAVRQSR